MDYFSDYFEVDKLGKKDASAIIGRLKRHFATHGIPDCIQSDNGPPYNSQEFADFAQSYGFELSKSSPQFPQSNGKVEAAVKIAKRLVKRSKHDHGDFYLSLLIWRNTPTASMDSSPAQRLLGRRTKNNVPMAAQLLEPRIITDVENAKTSVPKSSGKVSRCQCERLGTIEKGRCSENTTQEKACRLGESESS